MRAFSEAVKWVFLDLDNTLWDFDANAEEAIKELYHRHELHLHCDFHVDQFFKNIRRLFGHCSVDPNTHDLLSSMHSLDNVFGNVLK